MKLENVFSDPECPLVFSICDVVNDINIKLKGRQGTLKSGVLFSKISVFSFIVVILNFLNYRRSVLFPKIVVSALVGLVLYLCQDFSCLMTGSRFWYFCNNSCVIVSVEGRKMFSISVFDRGTVSRGS